MFMRQPRLPVELLIEKPAEAAYETEDEYVSVASKRMREAFAIVREHLKASFESQDERVKPACFHVADFVWHFISRNRKGLNNKKA